MKKINFENHFTVDRDASEPVYQQLVEAVLYATKTGLMDRGDRLPSINELSRHYAVSRSTIEKSYNNLRDMGILASQHGKSYYINRLDPAPELKVLVLFDQLNAYNKEIYDALAEHLGQRAELDFQVYYSCAAHLKQLLRRKQAAYSHILIIPHFLDDPEAGHQCIARIPDDKLILLDLAAGMPDRPGTVQGNRPQDILQALGQLLPSLRKYQRINLILPDFSAEWQPLSKAFKIFCEENNLVGHVPVSLSEDLIPEGEAFFVLSDKDLMLLVRTIHGRHLAPGKDVGIVSYQENDAKKALLNGITTISPDYKNIGKTAAGMVLTGHFRQVESPCRLYVRGSL